MITNKKLKQFLQREIEKNKATQQNDEELNAAYETINRQEILIENLQKKYSKINGKRIYQDRKSHVLYAAFIIGVGVVALWKLLNPTPSSPAPIRQRAVRNRKCFPKSIKTNKTIKNIGIICSITLIY